MVRKLHHHIELIKRNVRKKLRRLRTLNNDNITNYKPLANEIANAISKKGIKIESTLEDEIYNQPSKIQLKKSPKDNEENFIKYRKPDIDVSDDVFEYIPELQEPNNELRDKIDISQIHNDSFHDYLQQYKGELPREYMEAFIIDDSRFDKKYLVHDQILDKLWFGNSELKFVNDDIEVNKRQFKGTRGLYELIFKLDPNRSFVTAADSEAYGQLIQLTSANKLDFDINKRNIGDRSKKYTNFIKPALNKSIKYGKGYMQYTNKPIDYIYFDDPNELVERLKLLIASTQSGNNAHNNEVMSIIEELRELNLII